VTDCCALPLATVGPSVTIKPWGTTPRHHHSPMTTTLCLAATLLAILTIPVLILLWATESREQRIRRWRADGMSQQAIADRLGITRYAVRRALA